MTHPATLPDDICCAPVPQRPKPMPLSKDQPPAPVQRRKQGPGWPGAICPFPQPLLLPTLTPCPPAPTSPPLTLSLSKGVLPAQPGEPPRLPSPTAAEAQCSEVWVQSLPRRRPGAGPACLVSLCRFRATFHPGRRPTFGPRPAKCGLFPFFGLFNAPRMGPRPSSGPCLAATTCLLLSTCPSRLNRKLRRDLPGTGSRKKRAAQFNTNQIAVAA